MRDDPRPEQEAETSADERLRQLLAVETRLQGLVRAAEERAARRLPRHVTRATDG
jgi:hypothetical protein